MTPIAFNFLRPEDSSLTHNLGVVSKFDYNFFSRLSFLIILMQMDRIYIGQSK